MSWYEIKITPEHKGDYVRGGRILLVWDDRPHEQISETLRAAGSVTLHRGAFTPDKMRIEDRGMLTIFAGHLISIEDRVDYNSRFPKGPLPRSPL